MFFTFGKGEGFRAQRALETAGGMGALVLMTDPQAFKDEIQRMWQEAEFYESQGLYDQAVQVYQNILEREPGNRKAQAKVVQIQFTQKVESTTLPPVVPTHDFTPTLALDLGQAYMGMNLYAEALAEFRKALPVATPANRLALLQNSATCLIRLRQFEEAAGIIEEIILDQTVPQDHRGAILDELIGVYLDEDLTVKAREILLKAPQEIRALVTGCDSILAAGALPAMAASESSDISPDSEAEITIDDMLVEQDDTTSDHSRAYGWQDHFEPIYGLFRYYGSRNWCIPLLRNYPKGTSQQESRQRSSSSLREGAYPWLQFVRTRW